MRVLVVEDDENKRKQLLSFIGGSYPDVEALAVRSYQSGLRTILEGDLDLVLLDMTMPSFDVSADDPGGGLQHFAGREILRQMERRRIKTPVIVVTQFDQFGSPGGVVTLRELDESLRRAHPGVYRGAVSYSASSDTWKTVLTQHLRDLREAQK